MKKLVPVILISLMLVGIIPAPAVLAILPQDSIFIITQNFKAEAWRDGASLSGWAGTESGGNTYFPPSRAVSGENRGEMKFFIREAGSYRFHAKIRGQKDGTNRSTIIEVNGQEMVLGPHTQPYAPNAPSSINNFWDSVPRRAEAGQWVEESKSLTAGWHTLVLRSNNTNAGMDGLIIQKADATPPGAVGPDQARDLQQWADITPPVFNAGQSQARAESNTSIIISDWPDATDKMGVTTARTSVVAGGEAIETGSVTGALAEYAIYRKPATGGSFTRVGAVSPGAAKTFTDTGLAPGTEYIYVIRAYDKVGQFAQTAEFSETTTGVNDSAPPTWPLDAQIRINSVTPFAAYASGVTASLSWTAAVDNYGVESYNVYKDSVLPQNLLGVSSTPSITVTGLTPEAETNIVIEAVDVAGNKTAAAITTQIKQILISPAHKTTTISHYADAPAFSSSTAAGGYNSNSSYWSGTTNAYAQWKPDITTAGYYNVRVFRPYQSGNSPYLEVEIAAGGKTLTFNTDWLISPSGWVDLGSYYFDVTSGVFDQYVQLKKTLTGAGTGNIRVDSAMFSFVDVEADDSLLQGVIIGKEFIRHIQGKAINAECGGSVDMVPVPVNKGADITINGNAAAAYEPFSVVCSEKFQTINIEAACGGSSEGYQMFLYGETVIDERDSEVTPALLEAGNDRTGWVNSSLPGYRGTTVWTSAVNTPRKYPINQKGGVTVKGLTEVWIFNAINDNDTDISNQDSDVGVRVIAAGVAYDLSIDQTTATGTKGFIKIGEFRFNGTADGSEYVEIYKKEGRAATAFVRAAEIKFINVDSYAIKSRGYIKNNAPADAVDGAGSYIGVAEIYNYKAEAAPATIVFAVYKESRLVGVTLTSDTLPAAPGVYRVETENPIILNAMEAAGCYAKIMVWGNLEGIIPLPEI